jgi:uncharacterized protein YacL
MVAQKKRISKPKQPALWQKIVVHAVGTPGYILWLFGVLIPLTSALIVFAVNTSNTALAPPENASFEFNIQPNNMVQSLLLITVSFVLWYAIAAFLRGIVEAIANRSDNPVRTWWLINIGGLVIGWLLAGVILKALNISNEVIIGLITLAFSMGLVSFGLEYFLGRKWRLIA